MKFRHLLYGLLVLSLCFAGVMIFLYYSSRSPETDQDSKVKVVVKDRAKTVSGRGGKLEIAYAGDLIGNLDPCG